MLATVRHDLNGMHLVNVELSDRDMREWVEGKRPCTFNLVLGKSSTRTRVIQYLLLSMFLHVDTLISLTNTFCFVSNIR